MVGWQPSVNQIREGYLPLAGYRACQPGIPENCHIVEVLGRLAPKKEVLTELKFGAIDPDGTHTVVVQVLGKLLTASPTRPPNA